MVFYARFLRYDLESFDPVAADGRISKMEVNRLFESVYEEVSYFQAFKCILLQYFCSLALIVALFFGTYYGLEPVAKKTHSRLML